MTTKRLSTLIGALLGLVVLVLVVTGIPRTGDAPTGSASVAQPSAAARPTATGVANPSRLPEIKASDLPAEARQVLALIARGGPYPYSRDNITFGNFERVLPQKPSGYYREFTVPTPGESDRGARRIVTGGSGEKYYTADHYSSFSFIADGK